jgi:hypothetical protein
MKTPLIWAVVLLASSKVFTAESAEYAEIFSFNFSSAVSAFSAVSFTVLSPFESSAALMPRSQIDELVFGRLEQLGIQPANICSDAVFVRRAYLDVIGTLPAAQEARTFILDQDPNKRSTLIDHLLEREEFADYWAMKWSDLLRVKAEFPINLWPNAVQAYHRWIRSCIKENLPYDRFVREMLVSSGSNFRVSQVNFYRAIQSKQPQAIAQAVALTFMGVRAENWPKNRLSGMAAFFSQVGYKQTAEWKEEIVWFDPNKAELTAENAETAEEKSRSKISASSANSAVKAAAVFPDGTPAHLSPDKDPREVFADWLITPKNPWFTRNIANRVWSWLLGRGIIHEPDDIRPDNPPSNPELLAFLEQELITARYDLKQLYRLILNSQTYQLSSIAKSDKPEGEANFAYYPLRRLEAEVLIDALNEITGTTEKYSSAIPEPFSFIPEEQRSIALADGSITSSFLELFGRPPRDTGLESERNNRPSAAQRLHLLNSSHIQRKIEQSRKLQSLMQAKGKPGDVVTGLYLTILSRFPTDEELKTVAAYTRSGGAKGREAAVDLAWALINSPEFLYRH